MKLEETDYYIENGKYVFTEQYLLNRGFCCNSNCRHCPYREVSMLNPGQYIWRTKDADYPVTVVEFLGRGPDGREYAKINGSNTAIPVDELRKEKTVTSISKKPPAKRLL